ncbi:hypothetical protein BDW22DRAFT_1352734 [Trametopsis cervina]|nr:hypothetical protein BDW22DRAFT_1352734 [Trametopsis cervina]
MNLLLVHELPEHLHAHAVFIRPRLHRPRRTQDLALVVPNVGRPHAPSSSRFVHWQSSVPLSSPSSIFVLPRYRLEVPSCHGTLAPCLTLATVLCWVWEDILLVDGLDSLTTRLILPLPQSEALYMKGTPMLRWWPLFQRREPVRRG